MIFHSVETPFCHNLKAQKYHPILDYNKFIVLTNEEYPKTLEEKTKDKGNKKKCE
jgi:hypothetical protein